MKLTKVRLDCKKIDENKQYLVRYRCWNGCGSYDVVFVSPPTITKLGIYFDDVKSKTVVTLDEVKELMEITL